MEKTKPKDILNFLKNEQQNIIITKLCGPHKDFGEYYSLPLKFSLDEYNDMISFYCDNELSVYSDFCFSLSKSILIISPIPNVYNNMYIDFICSDLKFNTYIIFETSDRRIFHLLLNSDLGCTDIYKSINFREFNNAKYFSCKTLGHNIYEFDSINDDNDFFSYMQSFDILQEINDNDSATHSSKHNSFMLEDHISVSVTSTGLHYNLLENDKDINDKNLCFIKINCNDNAITNLLLHTINILAKDTNSTFNYIIQSITNLYDYNYKLIYIVLEMGSVNEGNSIYVRSYEPLINEIRKLGYTLLPCDEFTLLFEKSSVAFTK